LLNHPAVTKAQVELVFDPPWHPGLVLDAGRAARPEFF
jgi:metal-sulfur cluster biosynthetic enzyme